MCRRATTSIEACKGFVLVILKAPTQSIIGFRILWGSGFSGAQWFRLQGGELLGFQGSMSGTLSGFKDAWMGSSPP